MDNKQIKNDHYFNIDREDIDVLNMLLLWGGYLVGNQVD
ncbi:MAG: uracil phosphoribosyltransferase [Moritella sp.]|nr:uracil phosphoribosyltransferase [Moritella sp.]MDX2322323.1 uracil phosphoribosyltransferase [Moritella sp.]